MTMEHFKHFFWSMGNLSSGSCHCLGEWNFN